MDHDHTGEKTCPKCETNKQYRLKAFMAAGLSAADAHLVDDLATHSVNETIEAISRVSATAPIHLVDHVHWAAIQMVIANYTKALEAGLALAAATQRRKL